MIDSAQQPGGGRPRAALALIMLIALAHGLIYALGLPLWQAPDEPMLYEYAALAAELGRVPVAADSSPALERQIVASMGRQGFWPALLGRQPAPPPTSMAEAQSLFAMPRQVGGDPPVYFLLAALPLRLTSGWGIDAQARMLRALNALLLPLAALCAYQIARELGAPAGAGLAAAALVALQPMYVFIGAAVSNDGLANLAAALLCLLIVRAIRRGLPGRELALALALAALALQIKRTAVPLAILTAALAAIWLARRLWPPRGAPAGRRRGLAALGLALATLALGGLGLGSQLAWGQADRWYDAQSLYPAPRVAAAGGHALGLAQGQEAIQVLPDVATIYLRNGAVRLGARVWSDGPAIVRMVVYTGARRQERSFALSGVADAEMSAAIGSLAGDVRLGIVAEQGQIRVGKIWMRAVGLPGQLIANGDLDRPALAASSPLIPAVRYLRLNDLAWAAESGRAGWGLALGEWLRWLFDSFWGHFGWMRIAVVRDSPWEPAIAVLCVGGLAGAALALGRQGRGRRAPLAALAALGLGSLALLALNALIDPYPTQQGRYLFPLLPALAAALAAGYAALVPARLWPPWQALWLGFWLSLSGAALIRLAAVYYW